ncbi:MAG: Dabb family protein [Microthrixaceae bacterium]
MTLRHVALFRWREGTTSAQIEAVRAGLSSLPAAVPSIRSYTHGPDAELGEGRWDYAVVVDFDDAAGFEAYVGHPAHVEVRDTLIAPLLADRGNVQLRL